MKRFEFRLDRVERVRKIQRDTAKAAWVHARGNETLVRNRLDAVHAQAQADAVDMRVGGTGARSDVRRIAFTAQLRAQAVVAARADLDAASAVTAEAGAELQVRQRTVDGLERLRDAARDTWQVETRRDEAKTLDDMAGQRHGMGAHGGGAS